MSNVGYQYMLDHANEVRKFDIINNQLPEVAEAATKIGILGFLQGKRGNETDRPVFALNFYGKPLAVAVSVGNNGFVKTESGMMRRDLIILQKLLRIFTFVIQISEPAARKSEMMRS